VSLGEQGQQAGPLLAILDFRQRGAQSRATQQVPGPAPAPTPARTAHTHNHTHTQLTQNSTTHLPPKKDLPGFRALARCLDPPLCAALYPVSRRILNKFFSAFFALALALLLLLHPSSSLFLPQLQITPTVHPFFVALGSATGC
jgi:hypothetical protein